MNKIENGLKLDFANVLIRPKRSTINSRSKVDLLRSFRFKNSTHNFPLNSNKQWEGTPIISANMDTTGTFEVYKILSKHNIITAMNKFYDLQNYIEAKKTV